MCSWSQADLMPTPPLSKHAEVREGACSLAKSTLQGSRSNWKRLQREAAPWGGARGIMLVRQPQAVSQTPSRGLRGDGGEGPQGLGFVESGGPSRESTHHPSTRQGRA